MKVLVTGVAGFIGMHVAKKMLSQGETVTGIDNLNDYYDVRLKKNRITENAGFDNFQFHKIDIAESEALKKLFCENEFDCVVHLAAQAGVRYSLVNPQAYIHSNVSGFANVLECCKTHKIKHLVFASSSSVYGNNKMPFNENAPIDNPVSLYAATKKSNELMAYAYANVFKLPVTGLRFFTVYGPWGRPDMATFLFVKAILNDQPISVFNNGDLQRDFTYIDDIVEGVIRIVKKIPSASIPYEIYNIGNNRPVKLLDFIGEIEKAVGKKAKKKLMPMQAGDLKATYADISKLRKAVGFEPKTNIEEGIERFVEWYLGYFKRTN